MIRSARPLTPFALAAAAFLAAPVHAQTAPAPAAPAAAPAAPAAPEQSLTANIGLFSQYIFRGISQTAGQPAVQGGFDYTHPSGFYLGTWASNISWLQDFGAYSRSSLEWDFYGGYKNNFPGSDDWNYDVGTLYYWYPGKRNPGYYNADTWELYGAIGWKWVSFKASYSLQNYFGAEPTGQKTDGTWYLDLSGTYPIAESGVGILFHYGYLDVKNDGSGSTKLGYQDWKLGVNYTIPEGLFKGIEIGAYYTDNNADTTAYTDLSGYKTAKATGVAYVKKTL